MAEIEEKFYKTFGIEPKYQDTCTVEEKYWSNEELANEYGTFDMYMNAKCGNQENCTTECSCAYQKEIYPTITDRILLELICILNDFEGISVKATTIEELKEELLKQCIEPFEYPIAFEEHYEFDKLYQQVRALFEEGAEDE